MIGRLLTRAARSVPGPTTYPSPSLLPGGVLSLPAPDVLAWVSEDEATDLAPVAGFLNILSALVLQMPLGAYVGTEVVAPTPPVLRNPVPGGNRVLGDWLGEVLRDLALFGNYVALLGGPSWTGWPDTMSPVPFGSWSVDDRGTYLVGGQRYAPDAVFHVARGRRTGERVGRGLMQGHRRLLASAVAAESWAARYFDGGAVPPAVLTHPDPELTQDKAETLKAKLRAATRSRTAVVVPTGTTLTPLSSDADSAQLGETRRWNALQLCQALGIPAALLGLDAPSLTYRNIQDVFSQFVATTVMGYLAPLEAQLSAQCLPRTMVAKFDTNAVLRPDLAARVALAVQGLGGNVYTPEEARALLDLPPGDNQPVAEGPPALSVVPQEAAP